jgi:TRAP transporter TAXI family solute receptor
MEEIVMKKLSLLLVVVMIIATALCACGSGDNGGGDAAAGPTNIAMATGGTSGTYYGFSSIVAQVLNEKIGDVLNISVESTGASKANIQLVAAGQDQIAIVQNDVMTYAYNGTDLFSEDGAITNFSAVMTMYPETVQIIANKSITSIDQLAGKKVSVGDAGSGVEFNATQILAAYGIDINSDIVKNNQSFADSADSLKNGTIDAAFVVAGAPTTAVVELASTYDFNILAVDTEHAAQLQADYPFYTVTEIPGGTYGPVADPVQTVSVMATYIASNDLSEDVVYAFVKAIIENKDAIAAGNAKGELIDIETAVSGINIPFHPGAKKYYEEVGAL